jgi:NAD(P)-dependent dehydrogenase (short-subunit alcohol dehydrogenase family)
MNRMDGKVCVIAGATQGLGAAIARQLAAAGASGIVVTGRNEDRGAAVVKDITSTSGVPALFVRGDLSSVGDCRRMVTETDRHFGRVNVLVNAGASTERGTILDTSPELFDRMFAINVRGPFFLMQEAIKLMIRDALEGAICNIGSISALAGQPFINPYCASKAALTTLTANTAFSVMRNRIRVNQLNVGWMASDNEKVVQAVASGDPDWMEKAASRLPFGRLIDPEEAASAVNFFVSDDTGLMTGAIVNFDQSVWGAVPGVMPVPDAPMKLGARPDSVWRA